LHRAGCVVTSRPNKKFLIISAAALLVLVVGSYIVLRLFLGSVVTAGVNNFAPKVTQTKVVLAGATISPLSGTGTLRGLVIGNPEGWSDNDLCSLGRIHIDLAPFSVLGDHIIINRIEIDAPEFNYETKIVASNVADLLKNIEQFTGGASDQEASAKDDGKPIKLEVKHFSMRNGNVRLGVGAAAMSLPMPPIELNDLGTKEGGITPGQLTFAVMRSVTTSVVSATTAAAGQIGSTTGAAAAEGVKKAGAAIKGLFGGGKKE